MNHVKISINNLANEITQTLKEYTEEVEEGLEKAKEDTAKNGAKKLRSTSPKKTGKYSRSWRAKKQDEAWVIHNAKYYQLTHLLEKGHAKVNGGRVSGRPHIAPVEEQVIKDFEKEVERVIKG